MVATHFFYNFFAHSVPKKSKRAKDSGEISSFVLGWKAADPPILDNFILLSIFSDVKFAVSYQECESIRKFLYHAIS